MSNRFGGYDADSVALPTTSDMWLVYVSDDNQQRYFQPWQDLVSFGTLIDPDTGNDMDLLGWTTIDPEGN